MPNFLKLTPFFWCLLLVELVLFGNALRHVLDTGTPGYAWWTVALIVSAGCAYFVWWMGRQVYKMEHGEPYKTLF